MDHEFDSLTPSLTLEPELDLSTPAVQAEATEKIAEPVLTPQEQQLVADFAAKIDVENTAQILQYGAATQKKWLIFPMRLLPTSAHRT